MKHKDKKTQRNKPNHTNNEVVLTDGRPTYLEFEYTEDMSKPSEIWVENTSVEAEVTDTLSEQTLQYSA